MRSNNGPLKLFVGDLGDNRKSDLNHLFSKYGEITTIYFDEIKRFAFVEFTSSNDAQRALERTNNKTVNGSKLRVEYAKSDKPSRDHRPRDRSPTSMLYSHLQVTANRLPSRHVFRQNYYQQYPSTMFPTGNSTSRGRSLTPPSLKQHTHLRTQEFFYPHTNIYSDANYYTGDPYTMQRLPPPPSAFLSSTSPSSSSSSRAYRTMYSSSRMDRYSSRQERSRSRRRISPSHRERKRRGPRTPSPSKSSTHRSKKRSRSGSNADASTSERKFSSNSSSESDENEEKQSDSKKYPKNNSSNRKHSKRKKE